MRVHGRGGAGAGTPTGWPVNYYTSPPGSGVNGTTANQVSVLGFALPAQGVFSTLSAYISVPDGINNSDIGIYNVAGTLVAHIGAQTTSGNNDYHDFAIVGAPVTLPPGLYAYAWTSAGSTLSIGSNAGIRTWLYNANIAASVGGALPASIGALSISATDRHAQFALF